MVEILRFSAGAPPQTSQENQAGTRYHGESLPLERVMDSKLNYWYGILKARSPTRPTFCPGDGLRTIRSTRNSGYLSQEQRAGRISASGAMPPFLRKPTTLIPRMMVCEERADLAVFRVRGINRLNRRFRKPPFSQALRIGLRSLGNGLRCFIFTQLHLSGLAFPATPTLKKRSVCENRDGPCK